MADAGGRRLSESEGGSSTSDEEVSGEEEASWVAWFCGIRGNEFFCEVDEEYVHDDFNLTGLQQEVPYYDFALDTILDVDSPHAELLTEEQQETVDAAAELLYGLIHARFVVTLRGVQLMLAKYENGEFPQCPRLFCSQRGTCTLPMGTHDDLGHCKMLFFCPRCEEGVLLTVDVPRLGKRPRDLRNGFQTPFRIRPRQFLDFALHPRWSLGTLRAGRPRMANYDADPNAKGYDRNAPRTGATWEFLDRLRARWKGRLVVKGVLSPADAVRIRDAGADAVYVSNHGARQLDSAPSSISMLPAIRAAVGPDYPLLMDGGVRSGEDIVKALAAGADFALLGRPFMFAMGADGARGLARFMDGLAEEIAIALAQVGLRRVADIKPEILVRDPA